MRKFEYKEEYITSTWLDVDYLNEQGQNGWELIATESSSGGLFGDGGRNYLFKRMLPIIETRFHIYKRRQYGI